jgi:hypothetical protein
MTVVRIILAVGIIAVFAWLLAGNARHKQQWQNDGFQCPNGFEETSIVAVGDTFTVPEPTPGASIFSFGVGYPDGTHRHMSHLYPGDRIDNTVDATHIHICEHFYPPRKNFNTTP